ncbi:MAG: hypothetical protein L6R36_006401 [Xanthoria steineri]|nr:MAG: hypothetical protein L6R36_006401 [Xanthoria steineri]
MATSDNPRTVETLDLSQFGRQLYQWYFNEGKSMPQVKASFDILFRTVTDATCVVYDINERQWDNRAKKWMKSWGLTKAQQGELVAMPDSLKALPLWYQRDQPLLLFHACTPANCNSCASSRKQAGTGQHLDPTMMPGCHQCPSCGTTCAVCANPQSAVPPKMMRSYPGLPMTAASEALPNAVDDWSFVQGSFGQPYPPHMGFNPSRVNFQGGPHPSSQYNFATGHPRALLPYRTPAPILASTKTSAERQRATPGSRKRSRRNSAEPNSVVETSVKTADHTDQSFL